MASFQKTDKGWRVFVARKGFRKSATFKTKREANEWAARMEISASERAKDGIPNIHFTDLLNRYIDEVSVNKKGERWERLRLQLIGRMAIGKVMLPDFDERHVAQWRDERLKQVSPDSVAREWSTLNHACTIAVKEWKWLAKNPFSEVRKPQRSKPRERRISEEEIDRILHVTGYVPDEILKTSTQRTGCAFLFAIETAMRMSEITGLTWKDVDLERRTAFLSETKNGSSRTVPLSSKAIALLNQLDTQGNCFGMTSQSLEALFRKSRNKAMINNLHFHDTRHEAISRLSKKLGVMELARMVGHRDLRSLMVYYNPTAEELAKKLD